MARKAMSKNTVPYTRQVNLWVRPEVFKALKHRAVEEDRPLQEVVDDAFCHWLGLGPPGPTLTPGGVASEAGAN